jgi:hypothetical protein
MFSEGEMKERFGRKNEVEWGERIRWLQLFISSKLRHLTHSWADESHAHPVFDARKPRLEAELGHQWLSENDSNVRIFIVYLIKKNLKIGKN